MARLDAVRGFLRGARPAARANGRGVDWRGLSRCLGAPLRPMQARFVALFREEYGSQYDAEQPGRWVPVAAVRSPWGPADWERARRSFIERAVEQDMLPLEWLTPSPERRFASSGLNWPASEDLFADPDLPVALAPLGGAQLRRVEALMREALHRHWNPAVRGAPLQWEAAAHDRHAELNAVYAWMHQWDRYETGVPSSAEFPSEDEVLEDATDAFRRDLARVDRTGEDLVEFTRQLRGLSDGNFNQGNMIDWVRWGQPYSQSPMTLLGRRLYTARFLNQLTRYKAPALSRLGGRNGPTRAELVAFYAPLVEVCRMGVLPGAITEACARLLVVIPHEDFPNRTAGTH